MRPFTFLVCFILTQFSFAGADRRALFAEAFNGLPFFVYSALQEMNEDFHLYSESDKLTPSEAKMASRLIHQVFPHHREKYGLTFSLAPRQSFKLKEGEEERTAMTSADLFDPIYVNLKRINDPQAQIDFVDAIQILIHETGHKIEGKDQVAIDTLASKIGNVLRNSYSVFNIHESRRLHILSLSRGNTFISNDLPQMETVWMNQLGFEVTTFDEIEGNFRSIEEIRHSFENPGVLNAWGGTQKKNSALSRSNIVGLEVDRFSDNTTVIRIATQQTQTLLKNRSELQDYSSVNQLNEYAITLKGSRPAKVSKREGYLPAQGSNPGVLRAFELKGSVLQGDGYLPYYHRDFKDLKLHLLVRTPIGLLSLPLKVVSTDPNGPLLFTFSRKMAQTFQTQELLATDVLVSKGLPDPANKLPLQDFKKVEVKGSLLKPSTFKLKNVFLSREGQWESIKKDEVVAKKGDNTLKFLFDSRTPLQEMTLYLKHSREVFDPQDLMARNRTQLQNQKTTLGPSLFDTPMSQEKETDVLRFDASHMKQRFVGGYLEVEVQISVREVTTLIKEYGPVVQKVDPRFDYKFTSQLEFGVDTYGRKDLAKIVAINENLQKVFLDRELFRFTLENKRTKASFDKAWQEYWSAFDANSDKPIATETPRCKNFF
jgi:hypothetical protein